MKLFSMEVSLEGGTEAMDPQKDVERSLTQFCERMRNRGYGCQIVEIREVHIAGDPPEAADAGLTADDAG